MAKKRLGSIKRFGVRYGRTVKFKFAQAEADMKSFQKCPYCSAMKVKRLAAGIWHCRKCDAKFTGKAYSISKTAKVESEEHANGKV
jgi:large subunit ribosomal protein L37Ae